VTDSVRPASRKRGCGSLLANASAPPNLVGRRAASALLLSLALPVYSVWSQQADQPSSNNGETRLEPIIVTANRREENMQSVPISIDVVRAGQLEDSGITDTKELGAVIPGLSFQTSLNGMQPHLRGIGTTALSPGEENSIAVYMDGVYIAGLSGGFLELSNIEQVEVDKGPQGTLFGRNATGGVINITTKDPQQQLGGQASVSYGNYDTVTTNDYITGGITDTLAADLAIHLSDQLDGYGKNLYNGEDINKSNDWAARSKWVLTPSDANKIALTLDYERTANSVFSALRPVSGYPTNWGPGAPYPTGQPYLFNGSPWDIANVSDPIHRFSQWGVALTDQSDWSFAKFTNILAFRQDTHFDFWSVQPAPTPAQLAYWYIKDWQVTEEAQLASAAGSPIKWVGGLFFMDDAANMDPLVTYGTAVTPPPLSGLYFHSVETSRSAAAYGQATTPIPWLNSTNFTAGLRYTAERRGIDGNFALLFEPPIPDVQASYVQDHQTFTKLTWRFALDHQFTDHILGYVSDNRGFKSGLYGTVPATIPAIQPEIIDAYEAGLKSDFPAQRLRLNTAFFYYNYSDLQVTVANRASESLQTGAKAKIYGVDLDLEAKLTEHLTINLGGEWIKDYFVSFDNATFFIPQTVAQGGGSVLESLSAAGKSLPYTPNYSLNVRANYTQTLPYGTLDYNLTYSYSGVWFPNADNILRSPISNLVNSQLGFTIPDSRIRVSAWVKNLTNQAVPMFLLSASNPGGYSFQIEQPPRTYGITVQYRF
jgi:iron complex outermembrane receptor protein